MFFKTFLESMPDFETKDVDIALDYYLDNYETISKQEINHISNLIALPIHNLLMRLRRTWDINHPHEFNDEHYENIQGHYCGKIIISLTYALDSIENIFSKSNNIMSSRFGFKNIIKLFGKTIAEIQKEIPKHIHDGQNYIFTQEFIEEIPNIVNIYNYLNNILEKTSSVLG